MLIREAKLEDIQQIQRVRHSVTENVLSDPSLVTDGDCAEFLMVRGKGWVCEKEQQIVGFSIVDLKEHNIWALFVDPNFEKRGLGKRLHDVMLEWYFEQTRANVWLGTSPKTRAELFYRKAGWVEVGKHGKELKFEMSYLNWLNR